MALEEGREPHAGGRREQQQEIPSLGNVQGCLSALRDRTSASQPSSSLSPAPCPQPLPAADRKQLGRRLAEACSLLTWLESASGSSGRKAVAGTSWKECLSGADRGERAGAHSQRPTRLRRALISSEMQGSLLCVVIRGWQWRRGEGVGGWEPSPVVCPGALLIQITGVRSSRQTGPSETPSLLVGSKWQVYHQTSSL